MKKFSKISLAVIATIVSSGCGKDLSGTYRGNETVSAPAAASLNPGTPTTETKGVTLNISQDGDKVNGQWDGDLTSGNFTGTVQDGDKIQVTNLVISIKQVNGSNVNSLGGNYSAPLTNSPTATSPVSMCSAGTFNGQLSFANDSLSGMLSGTGTNGTGLTGYSCSGGNVTRNVSVKK